MAHQDIEGLIGDQVGEIAIRGGILAGGSYVGSSQAIDFYAMTAQVGFGSSCYRQYIGIAGLSLLHGEDFSQSVGKPVGNGIKCGEFGIQVGQSAIATFE